VADTTGLDMHNEIEAYSKDGGFACLILHSPMLTLPMTSDTSTMYIQAVAHRLTQVGILRALTWPGFFLSTFLGSRVIVPAKKQSAIGSEMRRRDMFGIIQGWRTVF
jgi:hypothetical protein